MRVREIQKKAGAVWEWLARKELIDSDTRIYSCESFRKTGRECPPGALFVFIPGEFFQGILSDYYDSDYSLKLQYAFPRKVAREGLRFDYDEYEGNHAILYFYPRKREPRKPGPKWQLGGKR